MQEQTRESGQTCLVMVTHRWHQSSFCLAAVEATTAPLSPAGTSTTVPVTADATSTTEATEATEEPSTTEAAAVDATAVEECLTAAGLVVTRDGMLLSGVPGMGVNPAGESGTSGFPVVVFVFESDEQAVSERDFLNQTFSDAGEFVVSGSILVWLASATGAFRQQVLDCTVGLLS